jgi:hypothetical protein
MIVSWDFLLCSQAATCFGGPAASLFNVKKPDIKNSTNIKRGLKAVGEPIGM